MPERFEDAALPHLNAAYNLARWLTGRDHDAEDVVQEAYVRAMKGFAGFRGDDVRAWLLTIVRNTCYTWLRKNREDWAPLEQDGPDVPSAAPGPDELLMRNINSQMLREAIEALPVEFREVIVMRELEGLSYKQVAAVAGMPMGTVMSRLSRARQRLRELLSQQMIEEPQDGLPSNT